MGIVHSVNRPVAWAKVKAKHFGYRRICDEIHQIENPTISNVGEDVEQNKHTSTVGGHIMACSAELKIYIIT